MTVTIGQAGVKIDHRGAARVESVFQCSRFGHTRPGRAKDMRLVGIGREIISDPAGQHMGVVPSHLDQP